jgi:hypothetical protein
MQPPNIRTELYLWPNQLQMSAASNGTWDQQGIMQGLGHTREARLQRMMTTQLHRQQSAHCNKTWALRAMIKAAATEVCKQPHLLLLPISLSHYQQHSREGYCYLKHLPPREAPQKMQAAMQNHLIKPKCPWASSSQHQSQQKQARHQKQAKE